MDGTLLNENVEISDRAIDAIERTQKAGIEFMVATGRTVEHGYSLLKERGITCPFIELNGARFFNQSEELQYTRQMEKEDVSSLIEILDFYDIHNQFITQEGSYSNRTIEDYIESLRLSYKSINKSLTEEEATEQVINNMGHINLVDNYNFLFEDTEIQVLKTLANAQKDLNLIKKVQKTIEAELPELIVTSASDYNIEVNHIQANKGYAVAEYAQQQGYTPDEVITIGDNLNDITMLEWSNNSYAMANAHVEAKRVATHSAPSHVDDGVAQIMERVVAGKELVF